MKAVLLIFSLCAAFAEIAWCRPVEEEKQESTAPNPPPAGEVRVPNPPPSVLLQKIAGDWKHIQNELQSVGGADGFVKLVEEKDPDVGSLLDAYEVQITQGKNGASVIKPSDVLKPVSDSLANIRHACDGCGGLDGALNTVKFLRKLKLDMASDNAKRAASPAVSAPQ